MNDLELPVDNAQGVFSQDGKYYTWDDRTYAVRQGVKPKKGMYVTRGKGLRKAEQVKDGVAWLEGGYDAPVGTLTVVICNPGKRTSGHNRN